MNLLKTLPEGIRNSKLIPPREFDEKGTDNIIECLKEIRKKFVGESERNALNWWNEWEKEHVAIMTSSEDYVAHLAQNFKAYHTPLAEYLFGVAVPLNSAWRSKLSVDSSDINPGFQWPDILAAATQSVESESNPHPPDPRAIIVNQSELNDVLWEVNEKIKGFYSFLSSSLIKNISLLMAQKVQPSGHILKSSGTKKLALIERWKQNDSVFLTSMFSQVSPNNVNLIESLCSNGQTGLNIPILSRQNNISINKSILFEVNGDQSLENAGMDSILKLFRTRNKKISSLEINKGFKPSLFLDTSTCSSIMKPPSVVTTFRSINGQFKDMVIENFHRIYFPHFLGGVWGMVMLDIPSEHIFYIFHGSPVDSDVETRQLLDNIDLQFNSFLTEIIGDERQTDENVNWDVSLYPLNGCYSTEEYSGIFVASVLYFLVQECPIFIPSSRLNILRSKFSLWLIDGALPM